MPASAHHSPGPRWQRGEVVQLPVLRALLAAERPLSISDLHDATQAHPNSIQLRLKIMERNGDVHVVARRPRRFVLADNVQRKKSTQRDRIWRAMRVQTSFSIPDLMMTASASRRSAETFVNDLLRAGYVRVLKRGNGITGEWTIYRLVKRSGPWTPKTRKVRGSNRKSLFDPNDESEHDISPNPPDQRGKHHAKR